MTQNEVQILAKSKEAFKDAQNDWVRVGVKKEGVSPYPCSSIEQIVQSLKKDDIINLFISPRRHCIILQVFSSGKEKLHYIYLNDRTLVELYCYFKII